MKTVKSIIVSAILIVLVSVSAFAQSNAKVIAVINKADWCPTCQQNGERAMAAFMANNKDMSIQFVANDVTDDNTKQKSAAELKKLGLEEAVAANCKATGVAYFFNPKTKTLISQVSVAKTDQELALAMKDAKKGLK